MIVDTTFLIDLLRNSPKAVRKASELDLKEKAIYTTTITVFELWQGVLDLKNKEKIDKIHFFVKFSRVFCFRFGKCKNSWKNTF